jgi:sterol desaturase/sphingolipid hydroxylase (fatty acid hydroxylase superfamily)
MPLALQHLVEQAADALADAVAVLVLPTLAFLALALAVKRGEALAAGRRAIHETRTNLLIHLLDAVSVGPLLALAVAAMERRVGPSGFHLVPPEAWLSLPAVALAFVAVFLGDFVGYWRHRLEHTRYLWPSHAVHHSDTEMTWLTLSRFHPVNRATTTVLDGAVLLALGLPPFAILCNAIVKHLYGQFIHADLPWTFGFLGKVFVSPAMHRWHHSLNRAAFDTNYATVFSLFDLAFGTYRVPGPCTAPLGVTDRMGEGAFNQIAYPLRPRAYRARWKKKASSARSAARPEPQSRLASDRG